jgi:SNF2 family DNA or RNA helicase
MTQVWVDGQRIRVKSEFRYKDVCRAVAGARWDPVAKTWHYPATVEVAGDIIDRFGDLGLQATREFLELAGRARDAQAARQLRDRDDLDDFPGNPAMPAWNHQRQAFWFAEGQDASMLAVGMGGGKTKTTIGLLEQWGATRVVILCPSNVLRVWPKEFAGDPDAIPPKPGHQVRQWDVRNGLRWNRKGKLVSAKLADRLLEFDEALRDASPQRPVAVCLNYEALASERVRKWLFARTWDVGVLDESHRIKSPGGVWSKACESLRGHCERRLCLTGTPQPHSPLDVYAQFRFLDPGVFGTSYARFRQRYAVMGGYQGKQVLGMNEHTAPELAQRMARLAYIITKEDLDRELGLPEHIWLPFDRGRFDLKPETQRHYDTMVNDFVAQVEEGTVSVNNALTQLLRLQQITSGYLPVDKPCPDCEGDGCDRCSGVGFSQEIVQVGTEKRDAVLEWLKDIEAPTWEGEQPGVGRMTSEGEPVLICCRFIHDLDAVRWLAEQTGRRYGELSGRDKSGLTERATMRPDVDLMGVQIQAGGVGIDLTRARYAGNYSVGFSLGDFEQWGARYHRPGQTRTAYTQNFAANGTVDVAVFRALAERKEVVDSVLRMAKEGAL